MALHWPNVGVRAVPRLQHPCKKPCFHCKQCCPFGCRHHEPSDLPAAPTPDPVSLGMACPALRQPCSASATAAVVRLPLECQPGTALTGTRSAWLLERAAVHCLATPARAGWPLPAAPLRASSAGRRARWRMSQFSRPPPSHGRGLPCHDASPHVSLEFIIRTPKCECDVAGNGQLTRAECPLDDGLLEDADKHYGHAPTEVPGARGGFDQVVRDAHARPCVSRWRFFLTRPSY